MTGMYQIKMLILDSLNNDFPFRLFVGGPEN